MLMVSEFRFFQKEEHSKSEKIMCTCMHFVPCVIFFHPFFWHAVILSHVLHLELKLKAKTEISLCKAILENNPLPSLKIIKENIGMVKNQRETRQGWIVHNG